MSWCSITAARSPRARPAEMRADPAVIRAYLGEPRGRAAQAEAAPASALLLTLRGVDRVLWRHPSAEGRRPRRRQGRDRDPDRRQRRRQVDPADDHLRQSARPRGAIRFDGQRHHRLPTHEIVAPRHGPGARGPPHLPAHDGAGESADGRRTSPTGAFRRRPGRVFALFPRLRSGATSAAAPCRAASSRCWRSAAR